MCFLCSADCKYKFEKWGECDTASGIKSRSGTLVKALYDAECQPVMMATKPCSTKNKAKSKGKHFFFITIVQWVILAVWIMVEALYANIVSSCLGEISRPSVGVWVGCWIEHKPEELEWRGNRSTDLELILFQICCWKNICSFQAWHNMQKLWLTFVCELMFYNMQ